MFLMEGAVHMLCRPVHILSECVHKNGAVLTSQDNCIPQNKTIPPIIDKILQTYNSLTSLTNKMVIWQFTIQYEFKLDVIC